MLCVSFATKCHSFYSLTFEPEHSEKDVSETQNYVSSRAREIDKCKSVQPFHKQSVIPVSFTETTDRQFPDSRKLPIDSFRVSIGSFRNDRPFPDIR